MNNFNDNEDCFGFHSEYYIVPNWREQRRPPAERTERNYYRKEIQRGYTKFSKYKENIYFLSTYSYLSVPNGIAILKFDSKEKRTTAMKLNTKEKYQYIAVNRQGYFLYDRQTIALFGFDGREICQHKFGRNLYMECIYIYDNKVIYSETKTTESKICCVDMLSKKVDILWETQKSDTRFDDTFKLSYKENWGSELQLFKTPSNVGNICCVFLYANRERVVAGYTRNKGARGDISYIINIESNGSWSLLDCFASQGYWRKKYNLPPENARHIFSFHMLDDSMWVKTNDSDIKLVPAPIQKITQLQGSCPVEWELAPLKAGAVYYYFDGKKAYIPGILAVESMEKDGKSHQILFHPYQTTEFWNFGDFFIVPDEYGAVNYYDDNGKCAYRLTKYEEEEIISSAKAGEAEKTIVPDTSFITQKPTASTVTKETNIICPNCRQILPETAKFCFNCGSKIESEPVSTDTCTLKIAKDLVDEYVFRKQGTAVYNVLNASRVKLIWSMRRWMTELNITEVSKEDRQNFLREFDNIIMSSEEYKEYNTDMDSDKCLNQTDSNMTLSDLRQKASSVTEFREELLAYRKSLSNSWDYNAYVGILLGVGGSKHGDAACQNFAIGQGDNGNNTRKTLENKGLMQVFEKYKGKKLNDSVRLADVEQEICSIVPEYAAIRQKLNEVVFSQIDL